MSVYAAASGTHALIAGALEQQTPTAASPHMHGHAIAHDRDLGGDSTSSREAAPDSWRETNTRAAKWGPKYPTGLLDSIRWRETGTRATTISKCTDCGTKCIATVIPVPTTGACVGTFAAPQTLRVCVNSQAQADARGATAIAKLSVKDLSAYWSTSAAYTQDKCRGHWQYLVQVPSFVFTCYGGANDGQPCKGHADYFTCTHGTCILLQDRPNSPANWWDIVDRTQFGGAPGTPAGVVGWYCAHSPAAALALLKVGSYGTETHWGYSSSPWIQSECDWDDDLGNPRPDPNVDCKGVGAITPVTAPCCGFCVLRELQLAKLWSCTATSDPLRLNAYPPPLVTPQGTVANLTVLTSYCESSKVQCRNSRPCLGDPVRSEDLDSVLDPSLSPVQCDQLDSGCNPTTRICRFRIACDNRLASLRERVGYYQLPSSSSSSSGSGGGGPLAWGPGLVLIQAASVAFFLAARV